MLLLSNKCQYFKQIMYTSEKSSEIMSFSRTLSTVILSLLVLMLLVEVLICLTRISFAQMLEFYVQASEVERW